MLKTDRPAYTHQMHLQNDLRAGSGLSVHVARRLLKALGGSIAVSSQPGKVSLPC
jgi:signal transduction histidine kinase